jgi:hypothetical protein
MADGVAVTPSAASSRALGYVLVPAVVVTALLVEALVLPTAWLPLDGAAVAERARGLPGAITGPLYPLLLAPVARHTGTSSLLAAAAVLGALCWTAVLGPAYLLARRGAPPRTAAAAAALSVLVPGAVYAGALAPDALATLLAAAACLLEVEASERRSPGFLAGALACALAAAFTRPWLAALVPALALAYAVPRIRTRRLDPLWIAAAVAVLYGLYYGLGSASPALASATGRPWTVLRDGLGSVGAAVVGFGVVPAVLAGTRLARRPVGALLACALPALAFAAGLSAAGRGTGVDERPLLVLAPLVFALAAEAWTEHESGRARIALAAAGVAVLVACVPWPAARPTLANAPGLEFVRGLLGGSGAGPFVLAAVALAVAALLLRPSSRVAVAVLGGLVLVLVPGGELVAWNQARRASDALDTALPAPPDLIDRAVGSRAPAMVVAATGALSPQALAELRLWNRSLRSALVVDPQAADPATGTLPVADRPRAVLAAGVDVAGTVVARSVLGPVVDVHGPLRIAESVQGLYADGWSGSDVTYRRFSGRARTLRVLVSRRAWGGPEAPGAVSLVSSPIDGPATARRDVVVHSGKEVAVDLPVPPAPFEVDVHLDTFSPSSFGQSDTRRLGAQLSFVYPDQGVG